MWWWWLVRCACQNVPCFCMTSTIVVSLLRCKQMKWDHSRKNLTMTFELGRIMTWRLPAFSALLMLFSASLRTDVRVMLAVVMC